MIVNKKTLSTETELKQTLDTFKGFKCADIIDLNELPEVIFQFKIAGRKTLEFCIIVNKDGEMAADATNKIIVKDLTDFIWGTAKAFSKTLVASHNWNKLCGYSDGEFKI